MSLYLELSKPLIPHVVSIDDTGIDGCTRLLNIPREETRVEDASAGPATCSVKSTQRFGVGKQILATVQALKTLPFGSLESITDTRGMDGNISAMMLYLRVTGPGTLTNFVLMFARFGGRGTWTRTGIWTFRNFRAFGILFL